MAGGLLSLISNTNSINATTYFIGNPSTYFFATTYNQFCNFGIQKFRIDYNGSNSLQQNNTTNITFNISRFGDLLTDTYLVLTLPNIFSPIIENPTSDVSYGTYDFKWIKDIGTNIIKEITVKIDGSVIQQYSGAYIKNVVERDFDNNKKDIFNKMSGNVPEIHSPNLTTHTKENPNSYRIYPNCKGNNSYPSIKSRQIFIPINTWFSLTEYLAFPLVALQYSNLTIDFTLRPLSELYLVRDVSNINLTDYNLTPYISPADIASPRYNLSTFVTRYDDNIKNINDTSELNSILPSFNIFIVCNQIFLSEDQRCYFAKNNQDYLFKDVREHKIQDIVGSNKVDIESHSLVSGWMWYLQRSDIKKRNQWSNYSNLDHENINTNGINFINDLSMTTFTYNQGTAINDLSNIYITQNYSTIYEKEILKSLAIICDGAYRENFFSSGVFEYLDVYGTCNGSSRDGLYFYSFSLNNNPSKVQPYGVFNTNFFKKTEFEFVTLTPNIDADNNNIIATCDDDGNIISISKSNNSLYEYTYTITIQEERYNILSFGSGMATLKFTR